jgi:hypothetical protein
MLAPFLRRAARRLPAIALAVVALISLAGCNERELEKFFFMLLVLVVIAALVQLVLLTVLITGIVKLVQGKPDPRWGVAALVCGAFNGLPTLASPFSSAGFHLLSLGAFALSGGLLYVGWRNVRDAENPAPRPASPPSAPSPPGDTER